jgi:hypothetical protein
LKGIRRYTWRQLETYIAAANRYHRRRAREHLVLTSLAAQASTDEINEKLDELTD